jgi:predicted dehydrogenase
VFATVARTRYQRARPPFLATAIIQADTAQARLALNGAVVYDQRDVTLIAGSLGTLRSEGPSLSQQHVTLTTSHGRSSPALSGTWFENGFQGAMGELLCAIEEKREPCHSARDNLQTLALTFAALGSAKTGQPVGIGSIRRANLG